MVFGLVNGFRETKLESEHHFSCEEALLAPKEHRKKENLQETTRRLFLSY
jgi:hypothetical protein